MPKRLPKPCAQPLCPELTFDRFCPAHTSKHRKELDAARPSAAKRGYDRRWRRLRKLILARDPMCQDCGIEASTDVDHIVPKRQGGSDSPDNLQGLCGSCHARKTALTDGRWG